MSLTPPQRHAVDCIIAIFETGRIPSASSYSTCTILRDGAGISYGKHQCTDRSGSLDAVVKKYIEFGGLHAETIKAFLPYLAANKSCAENPAGPWSAETNSLVNLLKTAGQDPTMHRAQDTVFDRDYWAPAENMCKEMGLTSALAHAVIYDTCIHSGPGGVANIRRRFPASPPVKGGDEKQFIAQYLQAREDWLKASANELVRKTTYRMDAFQTLATNGNWDLALPLVIRGQKIV